MLFWTTLALANPRVGPVPAAPSWVEGAIERCARNDGESCAKAGAIAREHGVHPLAERLDDHACELGVFDAPCTPSAACRGGDVPSCRTLHGASGGGLDGAWPGLKRRCAEGARDACAYIEELGLDLPRRIDRLRWSHGEFRGDVAAAPDGQTFLVSVAGGVVYVRDGEEVGFIELPLGVFPYLRAIVWDGDAPTFPVGLARRHRGGSDREARTVGFWRSGTIHPVPDGWRGSAPSGARCRMPEAFADGSWWAVCNDAAGTALGLRADGKVLRGGPPWPHPLPHVWLTFHPVTNESAALVRTFEQEREHERQVVCSALPGGCREGGPVGGAADAIWVAGDAVHVLWFEAPPRREPIPSPSVQTPAGADPSTVVWPENPRLGLRATWQSMLTQAYAKGRTRTREAVERDAAPRSRATVRGRARDTDGWPLSDVQVSLGGRAKARAAVDGTFVLRDPPVGPQRMSVQHAWMRTKTIDVPSAGLVDLGEVFDAPKRLTSRALAKIPHAEAALTACVRSDLGACDALETLPWMPHHVRRTIATVRLGHQTPRSRPPLRWPAGAELRRVRLRVVDPAGWPAGNVGITRKGGGRWYTDPLGRVELSLPVGTNELGVEGPAERIEVPPGESVLALELVRPLR